MTDREWDLGEQPLSWSDVAGMAGKAAEGIEAAMNGQRTWVTKDGVRIAAIVPVADAERTELADKLLADHPEIGDLVGRMTEGKLTPVAAVREALAMRRRNKKTRA